MKISYELYDTVEQNEHIQEVYFTKDNTHFLNKHELEGKFYGRLKVKQVLSHSVGDKKFFKMETIHTPETLIVETLSRKDILKMEPVDEKEIFSATKSSRLRAEEKKAKAASELAKKDKEVKKDTKPVPTA